VYKRQQYSDAPGELVVDLDMSFFEFQEAGTDPESTRKLMIDEVETGKLYRILFTTFGGLFSYNIGDLVEFTSLKPPMLKVIGREKEDVTIIGPERINVNVIKKAVEDIAKNHEAVAERFFLSPYQNDNQKIGYLFCSEFIKAPVDFTLFLKSLDDEIKKTTQKYKDLRDTYKVALPPKLLTIKPGSVDKFILSQKEFAQGKVLNVYNDRKVPEQVFAFCRQHGLMLDEFVLQQ